MVLAALLVGLAGQFRFGSIRGDGHVRRYGVYPIVSTLSGGIKIRLNRSRMCLNSPRPEIQIRKGGHYEASVSDLDGHHLRCALVIRPAVAGRCREASQSRKESCSGDHVYTNDDIAAPSESEPAKPVVAAGTDAKTAPDADTKDSDKSADKKDSKADAAAAAKSDALKQKIADQKKLVSDQEHDLSIMEREHQIRVAEYYADAGTQLREGDKWFQDEKQYQSDLDGKKKALDDAKAALDDLNEQARKAGVPTS